MNLSSLFKIPKISSPLPPCGDVKTLSFRAENHNIFTAFSEFSYNNVDCIETVIESLKTEKRQRLLFEPDETSSILEEAKDNGLSCLPFTECIVMTMDSKDPCEDFKKSMEQMIEAHDGIKDCEKCLDELLTCYLKVNEKSNHRYIISAFFDLLISLYPLSETGAAVNSSASTSYSHSFTSPLSFCSSSPCLSLLETEDEIIGETVSPSDV